jgi:hypothetical protein
MAWPASHWFTDSLLHSHTMLVRVDAQRQGEKLPPDVIGADNYAQGLPIAAGSRIIMDSASKVRRQLELRLSDPRLNPRDPSSPLAPYGTELVVQYGIRYLGGVEYVPVGVFRLDEARGGLVSGEVSIIAPDRSRAIADAVFIRPRQSETGSLTIPAQIAKLITEVLPTVRIEDRTGSTAVTPRVTWEEDRWDAIEQLATSIGAEVIFDPQGTCVIRPVPSADALPSWWAQIGPAGTIVTGSTMLSRTGVHNIVVVRGERTDDGLPVHAVAYDDDPNSPTWYQGPFGQAPLIWSSPLITTAKQALDAANGLLTRRKAAIRELDLTMVPQPLLEPGDVLAVQYQDYSVDRLALVRCELPLTPEPMSVTARSGQVVIEAVPQITVPPEATVPMRIGLLTAPRNALTALEEFERMEAESQVNLRIRRSDSENLPTWSAHPASADVGLRASFATIRSDPTRMKRNLDEPALRAFVTAIPDDHIVYLCWQPYAEDPARKNDPATIRAGGANFARIVKDARGTRKVWVTWLYAGRSFAPLTNRNPDPWYWGDKSVEVIATDAINPYTHTDLRADAADHIGAIQGQQYAHRHGRRFGVAAMACYNGTGGKDADGYPIPDQAYFIDRGLGSILKYWAYPKVEFAIWAHIQGKYGPWYLDGSPESMDAWRDNIT